MITITGTAQFKAWQGKQLPGVEEVRPGVFSIPVPFINNPMRYTLAYLLVGEKEAALVDPGWDSDEGWEADRIQFQSWGVPADFLDEVAFHNDTWDQMANLQEPEHRLADGELLPVAGLQVRVLATPGHTPGHICLVDEANQLILTGDHVLPRITPHVSLETRDQVDPLGDYLASLEAMGVGADMEVLPAHEYRFRGLPERVVELRQHTLARSAEVLAVLESGTAETVWDVSRELTWSRGFDSLRGFTLRLALAETASHLVYLAARGTAVDIVVPRSTAAVG